jgi:hypothetical protein
MEREVRGAVYRGLGPSGGQPSGDRHIVGRCRVGFGEDEGEQRGEVRKGGPWGRTRER